MEFRRFRLLLIFFIISMSFILFAQLAEAGWYDASWLLRKNITINASRVSGNQTNFPVLINITDTDLRDDAQDDGDDILFTLNNGTTKLSHEIEFFNGTTGWLVAWVRMNVTNTTNTVIMMYYNNSVATNQQNVTGVWDSNYKTVWHMDGIGTTINDSTSNNIDRTLPSSWNWESSSKIAKGLAFTVQTVGSGHSVASGQSDGSDWTLSFLVKGNSQPTSAGYNDHFVAHTSRWGGLTIGAFGDPPPKYIDYTAYNQIRDTDSTNFGDVGWDFYSATLDWDGGGAGTVRLRIYKNGNIVGTYDKAQDNFPSSIKLGTQSDLYQAGVSIDEFRVSNIVRSADWILTEYNNQNSPSTFYSVGSEVSANTAPTTPTNITCNGSNNCNISVDTSVALNASGSTDADGDAITYFIEATLKNATIALNATNVSKAGGGFTGTGADGSVTISTSKNINLDILGSNRVTYPDGILTRVTANPTGTSISVANSSGFAANDEILLINLQGASGDIDDVGNYEFLEIDSVPNSTGLILKTSVQKSYDGTTFSNQKVVVQRVPQWTNVTIQSGGTLTANDWNGTLGGVVVFRATGAVNINSGGSLNMNGKGHRLGSGVASGNNIRGSQAESYNGTGSTQNANPNRGGGGGGDLTNVGVDACGEGGGGGGYATSGTAGGYGSSCGGSLPQANGGGTYGMVNLTKIYLGSGGGGGGKDEHSGTNCPSNPASGDGSDGAGMVIIYADNITVNGVLEANGNNGGEAPCNDDNGDGAGGSGGSIFMATNSITMASGSTEAIGGSGGTSNSVWNGAGGNGGSGRIRIEADSISGTTSPTASTAGTPTGSNIDVNTTYTTYNDVNSAFNSVTNITVTVEVDSYNPNASVTRSNSDPDLWLEIYDGSNFVEIGNFSLPNYYQGNQLNTTNQNISLTTTNSNILTAWTTAANQDLRIKGRYIDFVNSTTKDEINYTKVFVTINGKQWTEIGNHSATTTLTWNTTALDEQTCIDLRARAIDLTGSNTYSSYFTKGACLNISHERIPPQWSNNVTSPTEPATYSQGQSYQFNVTWDDNILGISTVLIEHNLTGSATPHNDTVTTYRTISGNKREYYFNANDLKAGTYAWREYANDSGNSRNSTPQWIYRVNKVSPSIQLELNGTQGDRTYTSPQATNATGYIITAEVTTGTLLRNGTIVASGNPATELIQLEAGTHNYTYNVSSSQNYTEGQITRIATISEAPACLQKEVNISGISSFFYNGSLMNTGIVNATAVEKQHRGSTGSISNGEWSVKFLACTDNVEFITAKISDNSNNIGFNELKIFSNNVSTSAITCTQQTVTLSGYAINLNNGDPMSGGKVRGSIHNTIYTNATTFSGDIWEVKIDSCLNSGRIYTVSVLVSDNDDTIRGEYYTKYAAR